MSNKLYQLSKKANQDLNQIWLYTSIKWSKKQADRYYNLIIDEIKFLAQNNESGKSLDFFRPDYRVSKVKSHLIFYKNINPIKVIRILHQRMDIENRLNE